MDSTPDLQEKKRMSKLQNRQYAELAKSDPEWLELRDKFQQVAAGDRAFLGRDTRAGRAQALEEQLEGFGDTSWDV